MQEGSPEILPENERARNMKDSEKYFLYKAIKFEANEYFWDHGYTLPELWKLAKVDSFWREVSKDDYKDAIKMRCFRGVKRGVVYSLTYRYEEV